MTRAELLARLTQDENALVERKEAAHQTEVAEAVVAFANSTPPEQEAVLILGQRADKTIAGLTGDMDKLQRKVLGWVSGYCYPPVTVHVEVLDGVGPGPVLAVIVPGGSKDRPHFAGPAKVRVGSVTRDASPELYEDLIASRNTVAGAILSHKGELVTVETIHQPPFGGIPSHSTQEYTIEGCTAHSVQLHSSGGTTRSVPLAQVVLSADPEHRRALKIFVKPL